MTILKGSKTYALKTNSISTENGSKAFSLEIQRILHKSVGSNKRNHNEIMDISLGRLWINQESINGC